MYGREIYYLNVEELINWAEKFIYIIKNLYRTYSGEGENKWREYALSTIRENRVTPKDYIGLIIKRKLTEV